MSGARNAIVLPPALDTGLPREGLREALFRARWLLGAYWLMTLTGFVLLAAVAFAYWHGSTGGFAMGALAAVSFAGVVVGNLLGALRIRTWAVSALVIGSTVATCVAGIGIGPVAVLYVLMFLWSIGCGHLTLQRRFSLATLWIPVICWTGVILTLLDRAGRMHAWQGGQKQNIWQPLPLGLLLLLIMMFFLFLAAQEHYHALVWQAAGKGGPVAVARHRVKGAVRLTGRGLAAILVLAAVVTAGVATVAPYLWRTAPTRRNGESSQEGPERQRRERPRETPDWDGDAFSRAVRRMVREVEEQGKGALPFVPLFLLRRPLRRAWLLWRLRRKGAPPSERAARLWRYLTIGLADAGLEPRPGEPLSDLVQRVNTTRAALGREPVPGLAESIGVHERVRYGLGIPPGALEQFDENAARAFTALRQPLGPWSRCQNWFRKLD